MDCTADCRHLRQVAWRELESVFEAFVEDPCSPWALTNPFARASMLALSRLTGILFPPGVDPTGLACCEKSLPPMVGEEPLIPPTTLPAPIPESSLLLLKLAPPPSSNPLIISPPPWMT